MLGSSSTTPAGPRCARSRWDRFLLAGTMARTSFPVRTSRIRIQFLFSVAELKAVCLDVEKGVFRPVEVTLYTMPVPNCCSSKSGSCVQLRRGLPRSRSSSFSTKKHLLHATRCSGWLCDVAFLKSLVGVHGFGFKMFTCDDLCE